LVPELRVGADEGRPIVVTDPDDEASRVFVEIAERVEELAPKKVYRPELKIT
jgi:MinD-like ATPase involved in chromosome partitioning or flagellar assembly